MSIWTDEGRKRYGYLRVPALREMVTLRGLSGLSKATKDELLEVLAKDDARTVAAAPSPQRYCATIDAVLTDEDIQLIQNVGWVTYNIVLEADDEYELALKVIELENDLQSNGRWVEIPRPTPVE